MTVANPYSSVAISGFDASPPPDDGTVSSSNKLEWAKHKNKLASPIKTLAEAINTQVLSAFGSLIMTTDPGQETVIVAMAMYD